MFDSAGDPPPPNNDAAIIKALRQQRNVLAGQMLELELSLMLERERSSALEKELIAVREGQTP